LPKFLARAVRLILSAAALLLSVSEATEVAAAGNPRLLEFLQDGTTTRAEVELRLGRPSLSLEQGKILAYRIGGYSGGRNYYVVKKDPERKWQRVHYSLVLVFDANQLLQRHNMVNVQ
jgi:hypothetical protein